MTIIAHHRPDRSADHDSRTPDPRTGQSWPIGETNSEHAEYTTPLGGPDWVLTLDWAG